MNLFYIETKTNWDRVEEVLEAWRRETEKSGRRPSEQYKAALEKTMQEIRAALRPIDRDWDVLLTQLRKLLAIGNQPRALKLVRAIRRDRQLRAWIAIPLFVLSLPFRWIWQGIKTLLSDD